MDKIDCKAYCDELLKSESINDCSRVPLPPCDEGQNYIFISYAHKDYKKVYQDLAFMYDSGVRFWYDEDLTAGDKWDDEVFKKIASPHCSGVIFFISESFFASKAVMKEIMTTLGKNEKVDSSELPKNFFCINLENVSPTELVAKGIEKLEVESDVISLIDCPLKDYLQSSFHNDMTYIPFELKAHKEKLLEQIRRKFNVIDLFLNDESLEGDYKGETLNGKRHGKGVCRYYDGSVYDGFWKENKRHGKGVMTFGSNDQRAFIDGIFFEGLANGFCTVEFKNGDKYEGEMQDGKITGRFVYTQKDGKRYVGNFVDGEKNGRGKMEFAETDSRLYYEGEWVHNSFNGEGTLVYRNGRRYEGCFRNGYFNGEGLYTYAKDEPYDYYKGEWKNGNCHGQGEYRQKNGNIYKGAFEDGNYSGYGEFRYSDGRCYKGQFRNGNFDGEGTYTYGENDNRDYFKGMWKNSKSEGPGEMVYKSGAVFRGEWKDDEVLNGSGTVEYDNGEVYVGKFKDGNYHGKGKLTYNKEDYRDYYDGDWENGLRSGEGEFRWKNGDIYVGEFKDGKYHGKGEFRFESGAVYIGEYKNEKRDGYGEFRLKNGDVYVGGFKDGKYHGKGEYRQKNGNIYKGAFEDGNFDGEGTYTYGENDNRDYFKGMWKNSKSEGPGEMVYKSGAVFRGEWKNDEVLNGSGTIEYDNGSVYIGEIKDGNYHGKGKLIYIKDDNREYYDGDWVNGKSEGHGEFRFKNGEVYIGRFKDSNRNGYGVCTYPVGSGNYKKYEGNWKDGKFHGKGVLEYYLKGGRYEGEFENGECHGKGIYSEEKGFLKKHPLKGIWVEGKYQSKLKKFLNVASSLYEVEYTGEKDSKGRPHGKGIRKFYDGTVEDGTFNHGVPDGYVVITKNGNKVCEGNFVNGCVHGRAKKWDDEGNWCEGEWDTGNLIYGKVFEDGVLYEGALKKGKLIGEGAFIFEDGTSCKCIDGKPTDPAFNEKLPESFKG